MSADLDTLMIALYIQIDDFLPERVGPGRPKRISDAEVICLAVAQMLLDCPNDRKFLAVASWRLGHLFPYLPKRSGYNKRVRALAPLIGECITHLAVTSPSFCDNLRLLDSTPIPCGRSRQTVERSDLAGHAAYGYCASHSRWFWGFRLYILCASDGTPIKFELAPANIGERQVAEEMLASIDLENYTVMADKGFSGEDFEQFMTSTGARFLRPDKNNEQPRFGRLGGTRQWIESVFATYKGQLSLERHGGRTLTGVCARIASRLLALTATLWHNQNTGNPGRHLTAYDH